MEKFDLPAFIAAAPWKFAATMADTPHSYTTRAKCQTLGIEAEFEAAVLFIRAEGYKRKFGKHTYTYFDVDGLSYWSMGFPIYMTKLINRATLAPDPQAALFGQEG